MRDYFLRRLLPQPMDAISADQVLFEGTDLAGADAATLHRIRGGRIGMSFQEPMTALNPVHRIGRQIAESLILHLGLDRRAALARGVTLLERVGNLIEEPLMIHGVGNPGERAAALNGRNCGRQAGPALHRTWRPATSTSDRPGGLERHLFPGQPAQQSQ